MEILRLAAQAEAAGRHVIHMEIGQPGTPAPEVARAALGTAMGQGSLGYTESLGLPALRQRIAGLYRDWYGVDLDPDRILVTPGSSGGFLLAFTSLFDPGDRVGIANPGYPAYRQILKAQGLEPALITTDLSDGYQPCPDQIEGAGLDGVLIASPANPTGTMLDHDALKALIEAAERSNTAFISDEIYHGLNYQGRCTSALEITDNAFVINSFSKYFSMTGWRVGWIVAPPNHIDRVNKLAQHMFICAPHASQITALAALDAGDELEANRATYARNRDIVLKMLPKAGITRFAPPDGGFYVYADISHLGDDSLTLARALLDEEGVAVTPGHDFDPVRGGSTWRLSYAASTADVEEGMARIARFTERRAR
ncbi:pyridoxal phosphate-dependent aminotransferase [Pseudooceanicola nitratireducens]|uniref:pyridoxal phosphate-dependent aminotransferase n=1 Tax=Pseudooceanicola nitratireducens TaxID=517719 RepID=UPI001C94DDF3|nr:aminotransferase class I/II-fold pyridoxal phosphate-dependent enzyme [Pseudooceanicola nitratireducens]MBY6157051.1 aminotransferase class I/II-fold pyridoxal phosphate-dependent enzyme [Pseudooceanicola nitratireducens]